MLPPDDERAQTVQIGAVLLFATLVIAASLYQATIIPVENEKVEYDAYQDASSDMTKLRNAMLSASSGSGTQAATVKTGAQYPSRIFFFNSLQPAGTVETTAPGNVTIRNASATPSQFKNVGEYVDLSGNTLNYTTRRVRFTPDYNHLTAAPIVLTNGFLYRAHDRPTPLATQTLVNGNTITLQTVVGDLHADGYTAPVTAVPVSTSVNTVSVTNTTSSPLTLTVPTRLNASEWENTVLSGQTGVHVADVRPGPRPDTVTVVMETGVNYELRVSRMELKERNDDPTAEDPPARYVVTQTDRNLTTNDNGRVKLVVQTRDALNNPVSNARVTFSSPVAKFETQAGQNLSESPTVRTNENGEAVVYYNATDYVGNLPVTARLGTGGSVSAEKRVEYVVTNTVTSGSGGGGGGSGSGTDINPGNYVVLDQAQRIDTNAPPDRYRVNVTFQNRGVTEANVTAMRFSFYFEQSNNGHVVSSTVYNQSGASVLQLPIRSTFKTMPYNASIPPNNATQSFEFAFDFQDKQGTVEDYDPVSQTDFFVVEVVYNDAFVATYFVSFQPK